MISPFPSSPPAEIVFLPEGEHQIHATVNGKAKHSTVRVTAAHGLEIAGRLQRDLSRRQSQNVRPWVDFEHKSGAASALPKSFRYEPGKGVMLAIDWTDAGRRAIEGKDYSYFSPVFFLGDNGEPDGLPEKGAIGALVNEPAFRDIPRIAATDCSVGYMDRARSLVAAGEVPDLASGCEKVFAADPSAYTAYLSSLRKGEAVELVEAEEFTECGPELVEAIYARIQQRGNDAVAAGDAATLDEGLILALHRDPKLYDQLLAAQEANPDHQVRPSIIQEIEQMREAATPSPKEILDEIAAKILSDGEAGSEDEAEIMAIERRPDLYQAIADNGAEMLRLRF